MPGAGVPPRLAAANPVRRSRGTSGRSRRSGDHYISEKLDPARGSLFTPRPGMVPAADPGDPSEVIADDRTRMNREWTPARTFYRRRGRHRTYDTAPARARNLRLHRMPCGHPAL